MAPGLIESTHWGLCGSGDVINQNVAAEIDFDIRQHLIQAFSADLAVIGQRLPGDTNRAIDNHQLPNKVKWRLNYNPAEAIRFIIEATAAQCPGWGLVY